MPYVLPEIRERLNKLIDDIVTEIVCIQEERACDISGMLNYTFSRLFKGIIDEYSLHYADINNFIGALECCKLELYRRVAAPYEDKKKRDNGDVFE